MAYWQTDYPRYDAVEDRYFEVAPAAYYDVRDLRPTHRIAAPLVRHAPPAYATRVVDYGPVAAERYAPQYEYIDEVISAEELERERARARARMKPASFDAASSSDRGSVYRLKQPEPKKRGPQSPPKTATERSPQARGPPPKSKFLEGVRKEWLQKLAEKKEKERRLQEAAQLKGRVYRKSVPVMIDPTQRWRPSVRKDANQEAPSQQTKKPPVPKFRKVKREENETVSREPPPPPTVMMDRSWGEEEEEGGEVILLDAHVKQPTHVPLSGEWDDVPRTTFALPEGSATSESRWFRGLDNRGRQFHWRELPASAAPPPLRAPTPRTRAIHAQLSAAVQRGTIEPTQYVELCDLLSHSAPVVGQRPAKGAVVKKNSSKR
eukprot:TRINITY_DN12911_c0_g1_i2.p1 TRINITY_DN12911_c0_g1~~TRINITY_DN12911_c0_g1_i2.p1  ORF type:complete len:378 (+),score=44.89 TRINITY_DN12911_c0_g1_i2:38-1171(+)